MKFGVTPVEISYFAEIAQTGTVADLLNFDFPSLVERAIEAGFKHVELTLDMVYVSPGSLSKDKIEKLANLAEKFGITYTAHLPLWSIEPASPVPHVRKASVEALVEAIRIVEELNPLCYVLHATGALASEFTRLTAPPQVKTLINEAFSSVASESVKSLIELSGLDSRKIAVENVEFDFEYTRRIVDENDTSICFDTGHLMAGYSGNYDPLRFLEENFDRIVELHLHDGYRRVVNGRVEIRDHLPLGEGDLPVCSLLNFLQENGFDGVIVFELPIKSALKSMEYIQLNCENLKL